jgi:hypothetical protein
MRNALNDTMAFLSRIKERKEQLRREQIASFLRRPENRGDKNALKEQPSRERIMAFVGRRENGVANNGLLDS